MRKRKLKRHLREAEARRDNFEAKLLQLEVDYDRIETAHRLDLDRLHIVRDQLADALADRDARDALQAELDREKKLHRITVENLLDCIRCLEALGCPQMPDGRFAPFGYVAPTGKVTLDPPYFCSRCAKLEAERDEAILERAKEHAGYAKTCNTVVALNSSNVQLERELAILRSDLKQLIAEREQRPGKREAEE